MDAVSAASAVLGIVGFGLQVYQTLFTFVTKVTDADQCVQSLMIDINLTVSALREVHDLLKKEESLQKTRKGCRLFSDDGLADTKRTADQCMSIFKSIVAFILKHSKKGKNKVSTEEQDPNYLRIYRAEVVSKLESIKWALVQDEVNLYMARLGTFKISLLLILSVTSLKAQHQTLNNSDIVTDRDLQVDILYIDNLEKAKKKANDKWTLLRAAILQKSQLANTTSQKSLPIHNKPANPEQEPLTYFDPQSDGVTDQAGRIPTHGASGAAKVAPHNEVPSGAPEVDAEGSVSHQPLAEPSTPDGIHQDVTVHPETDPASIPPLDLGLDPNPMIPKEPVDGRGKSLSNPDSTKGSSKGRTHQSHSSNKNDQTHPALNYNWTSFDAYLYKDEMVRKLKYTEAHINELARRVLQQSPNQWWKLFCSLSIEEHTGVEEAINERRTEETRCLLGIQVLSARYAHFLRSMLRLVSLGMLDHRYIETRALLIIIGNKAADTIAETAGGEVPPIFHHDAERRQHRAPSTVLSPTPWGAQRYHVDEKGPAPVTERPADPAMETIPDLDYFWAGGTKKKGKKKPKAAANLGRQAAAPSSPILLPFPPTQRHNFPHKSVYSLNYHDTEPTRGRAGPSRMRETDSAEDNDRLSDDRNPFKYLERQRPKDRARPLSSGLERIGGTKRKASNRPMQDIAVPILDSSLYTVSISDGSLDGSPPTERDGAEAARNRVQELLARWTAPVNNEDEDRERIVEGNVEDMDGPTIEEIK